MVGPNDEASRPRRIEGVNGPRPLTYGRDRRCVQPGCGTLLSSYNAGDCCGRHAGWPDPAPRKRRKRRPPTAEAAGSVAVNEPSSTT